MNIVIFSDLVKIYRKANFTSKGYADYFIENNDDLNILNKAINNFNISHIELTENDNPSIGEAVRLAVQNPPINLGWLYENSNEFIISDFIKSVPDNLPFFIKDINFYSEDTDVPVLIDTYSHVKALLSNFNKMAIYNNEALRRLIFAGKKTFELDYGVNHYSKEFIELLTELPSSKLEAVNKLTRWLSDEETSNHYEEKKSILALVLENYKLDNSLTIIDVIKNIEEISDSIRSQYNLYLEDFSYEKFVKKLEENSEKFVSRINESISKVLSQVLALPIAAAAPTILNGLQPNADNSKLFIAYIGLLAYAIICYLALITQKEVLESIESQVESFDRLGKIPMSLKVQWDDDKGRINKLIRKQEHLYHAMKWIVYLVVFFCGFKIIASLL